MRNRLVWGCGLVLGLSLATGGLAMPALSQDVPEDPELASLVAAERAFARLSIEKGMRAAFLANLADDAVIFRPGPVPATPWFEEHPPSPGTLEWEPDFASIAAGGDLGYTSGPWWYREGPSDDPVTGHFVSVWRREPDGAWKVVFDGGIRHELPSGPRGLATTPRPAMPLAGKRADRAAAERRLLEAERAFAEDAASLGRPAAFARHAAHDVRTYLPGQVPAVGREAGRTLFVQQAGRCSWKPIAAVASVLGDLGFVYGTALRQPPGAAPDSLEAAAFVRIWRRGAGDELEIVLDLASPMPPPATAAKTKADD